MSSLTVSNYLAILQDDPDHEEAFQGLRDLLGQGDAAAGDDAVRLLEAARVRHESRGEVRAAAWLIELETSLVGQDPNLQAALWKELGRLRREELLDEEGASAAYRKVLELEPSNQEVSEAIEQIEIAGKNWKQIAKRLQEEAEDASDANLKSSLLTRAASLIWQYKKRGREKEVDELLEKALVADPSDVRAARVYCETLRARGSWEELARVLMASAQATGAREEKLYLYLRAARTYATRVQNRELAATSYQQVLDLSPGHQAALSYLVEYYTERQEWDHLVALYEDALRSRRKLESEQGILLQLGMVHWRIRKAPSEAEPYFARLRKLDAAHPGMLDFYREQGDPQKLLGILGDAIRVVSDAKQKLELAVELARVAQKSDSTLERAIDAWKAVQRLEPQHPEAHASLKELCARAGKWNALVELQKAEIEALPRDQTEARVKLWRELVPIYRDKLELDVMVIQTYHAILQEVPNDTEALEQLVRTYESMGRWNDLIQILSKQADAATSDETKVGLYMRIATLWMERFANYNQAVRPLEQVLALDAGNREALSVLKDIHTKKRAWNSLYGVMRKELELSTDEKEQLDLRIELAKLAGDRLHRHADAIALWRQIVKDSPTTEGALSELEKLAEREKDWATLAEVLERRVSAESSDEAQVKLFQRLGAVYSDHLKDPVKAAGAWKRVLQLEPKNARALRTLREAFLASQDWEGLEALYREAKDWEGLVEVLGSAADRTDDREQKIRLSFRAAEIYENEIGEPQRAFRSYERVLAVDPINLRAAKALIPIYEKDEKWSRLIALFDVLLKGLKDDSPRGERLYVLEKLRRVSLDKLSDDAASVEYAARAYALAPNDPSVISGLEQSIEAAGAYPRLIELFTSRLNEAGDDEALQLRRSIASIAGEKLGQPEQAIEQLTRILDLRPSDPEATAILDRIYRTTNRVPELRKLYQHRIEHADNDETRLVLLGELARLEEEVAEDPESAASRYRAMLDLVPGGSPAADSALASLDRLATTRSNWDELEMVVRRRRDSASADTVADFTLRLAELLSGPKAQPESALEEYARVLEMRPGDERAISGLEALASTHANLTVAVGRLLEPAYEKARSHGKLAKVLRERLEKSADLEEKQSLRIRLAELFSGELADPNAAYNLLEAAFLDEPSNSELADKLSHAAEVSRQHQALAHAFAMAIEAGGLSDEYSVNLMGRTGRLYQDTLGKPAEAEPFFQRILTFQPLDEEAFKGLKDFYTNQERWDELKKLYRLRIEHTADVQAKLELLLQVCFLFEEILDDPQGSIDVYQQVLELDPDHATSRRALDRLYRRASRWKELSELVLYELDRAKGKEAVELHYELGQLNELKLSDFGKAVDHYEAVLAESPTHLRAQESLERLIGQAEYRQRIAGVLAPLYEDQGAWQDLTRVLEVQLEALTDVSSRVATLRRLGEVHEHKLHDANAAFHALARAVEIDAADSQTREELSRLATLRGSHRERAEVLEKAVQALPASSKALRGEILLELARLWQEQERNIDAAERQYRQLIELDRDHADTVLPAARALERIYIEKADYPSLAEALRTQIRFESDDRTRADLLVRLGRLLDETLHDSAGAIAVYQSQLQIEPTDRETLKALERLYAATEQWEVLVSTLRSREEIADDPKEQREILQRIGSTYETRMQQPEKALAAYQDILSRFGKDNATLLSLASLYEQMGGWSELLEIREQQYDLVADEVEKTELRFQMAELMRLRTSEPERAVEVYKEVLELVPGHEGTMAALRELTSQAGAPRIRVAAARVLVAQYDRDKKDEALVEALGIVAESEEQAERIEALRRATYVSESRLNNPARAFGFLGKAVRFGSGEQDFRVVLDQYEKLAQQTQQWKEYAETLEATAEEVFDADLQTEVWLRVADTYRTHLDGAARAREYYERVLTNVPHHQRALDALEDISARAGDPKSLLEVLRRKEAATDAKDAKVELWLRQALLCEAHLEDSAGAIAAYEQVLEEEERAVAYEGLERLYTSAARWNDLVQLHERRLERGSGDPVEIHYKLGRTYAQHLNDAHQAVDYLEEALKERKDHEPTIRELEKMMEEPDLRARAAEILEPVYLARLNWPKVTSTLEARLSAETDPETRKGIFRRLGQIHEEYLEDLEGAVETYSRLFKENPRDPEVWELLKRLGRVLDNWERIANIFASGLEEISMDDAETASLAAETATMYDQHTKAIDKAAALYKRAFAFDPTDARLFASLESAYQRLNANPELLALYREQIDRSSDGQERILLLRKSGRILRSLPDVDAAIAIYRELLEIDSEDAETLENLDTALTERAKWAELADHLRHRVAVTKTPTEKVVHSHRLSRILLDHLHDKEGALEVSEQTLQLDPSYGPTIETLEVLVQDADFRERIAELLEPIYRRADQWKKLIAVLEARVELTDSVADKVQWLSEIATLHEKRGERSDTAFRALTRAFVLEPSNESVRHEIDRLALALECWDDHVAAYERAASNVMEPKLISKLLTTIARVHDEKRGDPRASIETYERLLENDPEDATPLDALEGLHTLVGDWRGLVHALQRKVDRSNDTSERAEILRRIGSVLEELLGDPQAAIEAYRRASEEDAQDAIALESLDRLYTSASRFSDAAYVIRRRIELEADPETRIELGLRYADISEVQLQQPNDAIDALRKVLEDEPKHRVAIQGLGRLYSRQALWPELLENLRAQIELAENSEERVSLLQRLAEVLESELDDVPESIETYRKALEILPQHEPSISALMRIAQLEDHRSESYSVLAPLLQEQQRWNDLVRLLEIQVEHGGDASERCAELRRIAHIYEHRLTKPKEALETLIRALNEDPSDIKTADDMERLAAPLGEWAEAEQVFSSRASAVLEPVVARSLYLRAAKIAETHLKNDSRAIESFSRALEQVGDDDEVLQSLDRLYQRTEAWTSLGEILERRINASSDATIKVELLMRLSDLRLTRADDGRGALAALQEVLEVDPVHPGAISALERIADNKELGPDVVEILDQAYGRAGDPQKTAELYEVRIRLADTEGEQVRLLQDAARVWEAELHRPDKALDAYRRAFELDPRDETLLNELERVANVAGGWPTLRGLIERVAQTDSAEPSLRRDLYLRAARWYCDQLGDPTECESCLKNAIEADSECSEAYEQWVELLNAQARQSELVAVLRSWAKIEVDDLLRKQRLRQAAHIAERNLENLDVAVECHRSILDVDSSDRESLEELTRIRKLQGHWNDVVTLLERQVEAEASPERRLALRRQIAEVCSVQLKDPVRATDAYRAVLDEEPHDSQATRELETLYEAASRWEDLRELLERQAESSDSGSVRVRAHLRLAELLEQRFDRKSEAIEQLRAVLDEDHGHRVAYDHLERLLVAEKRWSEVVDLLERKAGVFGEAGDVDEEIAVLGRLAEFYAKRFANRDEAIRTYERIIAQRPTHIPTLEALATLQEQGEDWNATVEAWQRLMNALEGEKAMQAAYRVATLAEEQLRDHALAESALRKAQDANPGASETRERLKAFYERHNEHQKLAEVLRAEESSLTDAAARVALLRRAADLYLNYLQNPADATACLEKAAQLEPDNRAILLPLCDLYISLGRQQDAVPVLQRIIDSYGQRRVKELAQYHHRLGRALEGLGDTQAALQHYDSAFKIDLTNVVILRDLGKLCHTLGDLERAQKSFRALLLQKLDRGAGITKADVYYYLGDISAKQGDKPKAVSMLERAVAEQADHAAAKGLLSSLRGNA